MAAQRPLPLGVGHLSHPIADWDGNGQAGTRSQNKVYRGQVDDIIENMAMENDGYNWGEDPEQSGSVTNPTNKVLPLIHDHLILDIETFCKQDFPERKKYLFPWLKEYSITLISGWRGVGKTFFALGIADAVSAGKNFGPWRCECPAPVLFLDGEMPPQDIVERYKALTMDGQREHALYVYSDAYVNQNGGKRASLVDEDWRSDMKRCLISMGIKVFIVDNLASLTGGLDENAKKDWDPINGWLLELRYAGISTIMLHHVNKDGGQRGTSAREDNLDCSLLLKPPRNYDPEDGARFIVHFSKHRVESANLNAIADTEFKLDVDTNGKYLFTHGSARQKRELEILKLLDDRYSNKEIADIVGCHKSYVSKIKKKHNR